MWDVCNMHLTHITGTAHTSCQKKNNIHVAFACWAVSIVICPIYHALIGSKMST